MKKIITAVLFCITFSLFSYSQENTTISFLSQPYLQHLTEDAATVISVASKSCVSYVQYGKSPEALNSVFTSKHGQIDANVPVQKIRLSGLEPGTKYYYRVVSKEIKVYQAYKIVYGDSVVSTIRSFVTPHREISKFSFLAFNDVHSRPAFMSDVYQRNNDVSFVCFNGDMLDDIYTRDEIIRDFAAPAAASFAGSIPFVYTRGNHETRGPAARELSNFVETPNNQYYYSFSIGNTIFMVLDTGEDKPDTHAVYAGLADYDRYRTEQAEWIKRVVASREWKKAKHRIVCGHIPASSSNDGWHGSKEIATKFLPLLNKAKVDLYLAGHTHEPVLEKSGADHNFTMVVGGGPMKSDNKSNVTYIRVDVDNNNLKVGLYRYNGDLITEYKVK
ncbi:MAG: metallophosphoesterase [Paludibacter sp.]|nr:metallophosphoesterase [Paludibacter sp.]